MIKAVLNHQDEKMVLLGLSYENLDRLRDGKPIAISKQHMEILGVPGVEVFIFADDTEETIMKALDDRFVIKQCE